VDSPAGHEGVNRYFLLQLGGGCIPGGVPTLEHGND